MPKKSTGLRLTFYLSVSEKGATAERKSGCGACRNITTTDRHAAKTSTTFCVFSLDTVSTCIDTANPDSGDRGSARRTESRHFVWSVRVLRRPVRVLTTKPMRQICSPPADGARALLLGCAKNASPAKGGAFVFGLVLSRPLSRSATRVAPAPGRPVRQRGDCISVKIEGCPVQRGPKARRHKWRQ
jgi:hypothetical protein